MDYLSHTINLSDNQNIVFSVRPLDATHHTQELKDIGFLVHDKHGLGMGGCHEGNSEVQHPHIYNGVFDPRGESVLQGIPQLLMGIAQDVDGTKFRKFNGTFFVYDVAHHAAATLSTLLHHHACLSATHGCVEISSGFVVETIHHYTELITPLNDGLGLLHAGGVCGVLEALKQDLVFITVAAAERECQKQQGCRGEAAKLRFCLLGFVCVTFQHRTDFFANLR